MLRQIESHHIWHPDLFEIFELARLQKSPITIQSHLPLDACNTADIALVGRLATFGGQQARFVVQSMEMSLEKRFPADPGCEYSFALNLPLGKRRSSRIEYAGKATILDRVLQKNDLPAELLLRIALPSRIRHVRRHARRAGSECQGMIPGLILIDREPENRQQLLRLLQHYFRKNNPNRPRLINISAGGVCVQTSDSSGYRLLAADERYLFFFFLNSPRREKTPMVFLGRKVGAFKAQDSGEAALRIQFLRELVWNGPNAALEWRDVEASGSSNLRNLLGILPDDEEAAPMTFLEPREQEEPPRRPTPKVRRRANAVVPPPFPPIEQMAGANMARPFKKSED